jgi:hypothetical protein
MRIRRLPVAPRPYRDETTTSWLGRVACRYGLDARQLATHLVFDDPDAAPPPVSAMAATADQTRVWAKACGLDPARLQRLSLTRRYPRRSPTWFTNEGWVGGPPAVARSLPVCLACFDADHAVGRDSYLRAHWALAEHCVCPMHRGALRDRCPHCDHDLHVVFRLREGRARPVCRRCERLLTDRGGDDGPGDALLMKTAITLQGRVSAIVEDEAEQRARLETALATLWAPLGHPAAARPVLAHWFRTPGWRWASDARHAVGAQAPLGQLPMRWRVVTLMAMGDLFGLDLYMPDELPAATARLFGQAARRRPHLGTQSRPVQRGRCASKRSSAKYLRLSQALLAHPDWIAAAELPERARQRVQARLIDTALAKAAAPSAVGAAPGSFVQ